MACRTGCPTQDHKTWGDCARQSDFRVAYCGQGGLDASRQKAQDKELTAYRAARAEGIQPAGTQMHQVRQAVALSDREGKPAVVKS